MDQNTEQTVQRLINHLNSQMAANEDATSAIDVYKTANWIISQLDEVKQQALHLAEQDLRLNHQDYIKTPTGSAGWTEPRAKILNENEWQQAMARDPNLMKVQHNFEVSQSILQNAQEPFTETPKPTFFIR